MSYYFLFPISHIETLAPISHRVGPAIRSIVHLQFTMSNLDRFSSEDKRDEKNLPSDDLSGTDDRRVSLVTKEGEVVNAAGHRDQLKRQYGLLSICGLALTIDNAWVALGGSLTISLRTLLSPLMLAGLADLCEK